MMYLYHLKEDEESSDFEILANPVGFSTRTFVMQVAFASEESKRIYGNKDMDNVIECLKDIYGYEQVDYSATAHITSLRKEAIQKGEI